MILSRAATRAVPSCRARPWPRPSPPAPQPSCASATAPAQCRPRVLMRVTGAQVFAGGVVPNRVSYFSAFHQSVKRASTGDDDAGAQCQRSCAFLNISPQSTVPLTGGRSKTRPLGPTPSHEQGHGKIQLNEVLFINVSTGAHHHHHVTTNNKLWLRDNQPISNSGAVRYAFTATANSRGKVTLAWTDPAASPLSDVALVNDLDLVRLGAFVCVRYLHLRFSRVLVTVLSDCCSQRQLCERQCSVVFVVRWPRLPQQPSAANLQHIFAIVMTLTPIKFLFLCRSKLSWAR